MRDHFAIVQTTTQSFVQLDLDFRSHNTLFDLAGYVDLSDRIGCVVGDVGTVVVASEGVCLVVTRTQID